MYCRLSDVPMNLDLGCNAGCAHSSSGARVTLLGPVLLVAGTKNSAAGPRTAETCAGRGLANGDVAGGHVHGRVLSVTNKKQIIGLDVRRTVKELSWLASRLRQTSMQSARANERTTAVIHVCRHDEQSTF